MDKVQTQDVGEVKLEVGSVFGLLEGMLELQGTAAGSTGIWRARFLRFLRHAHASWAHLAKVLGLALGLS